MARSHAKILTSIWADPDFTALSAAAQRMYFTLLSQPKLSLVGVLDYVPQRWAKFSPDSTRRKVETAVRELEDHAYVVVDSDTVELLIRSFVRHDIANTVKNSKIQMGFWRAWATVSSTHLRRIIASEIPDELWNSTLVQVPADALELRPDPVDISSGSNRGEGTGSNHWIEPPDGTSCLLPPACNPLSPPFGTVSAIAAIDAAADSFIHSEDLIA